MLSEQIHFATSVIGALANAGSFRKQLSSMFSTATQGCTLDKVLKSLLKILLTSEAMLESTGRVAGLLGALVTGVSEVELPIA